MKFLSNYIDFIIEGVVKKTMRLHYSEQFRNLLTKLSRKNKYAKFLLVAEDSNQISDIYTLIDVTKKNDTISFIQVNRILRVEPDTQTYKNSDEYFLSRRITNDESNEFWQRGRTEIGIGRWIRRIVTDVHKSSITDAEIEKFVNQYKATFDGEDTNFEIVKGEDIRKWYLESNYEASKGQLGNSCMRYSRCQSYFDIYTKNPEVCSLLIMRSETNPEKISGRSLLWQLKNGKKFQDRIYTVNDSDREVFEEWAKQNDYLTYDDVNQEMEVELTDQGYSKFPYMDTFICYNPTTHMLSNQEHLWPENGYWMIQETGGGYKSDDVVWSDYHDEYISREDAVYCENVEDYLSKDDALYLEYKNEWAAPGDDVVFSEYHNEYFYSDDIVYSELMSDVLYPDNDNVIELIINGDGDNDWCVKSRVDLYIKVGSEYYSRKHCIKDPYTNKLEFISSEYERGLEEKIMTELGIERNETTLDRKGNPVNKVIDGVREDLRLKLLKFKLTEDIKNEIVENVIYKKQVKGVYWGLSKDDMPNEDDMFALLKSFMMTKRQSRSYSSTYISDLMRGFVFYRSEEMNKYEKKFISFNSSGVIRQMIRVCESFDFSKFEDDIYKRYLFITI